MIPQTTLSQVPAGKLARIRLHRSLPDVSHRLREMGFCENSLVRCMVNAEGNLICEVSNGRIGITSRVAQDILVVLCE